MACKHCPHCRAKGKAGTVENRQSAIWLMWMAGFGVPLIGSIVGIPDLSVRQIIGTRKLEMFRRASVYRQSWSQSSYEIRLRAANAIPIRTSNRLRQRDDARTFWDVDVPPDDWLTRHKDRDPRR